MAPERLLRRVLRAPYRIAMAASSLVTARPSEGVRGMVRFARDLAAYRSRARPPFIVNWRHIYPILTDFEQTAGTASGHYFHQDLWAAKKIYANRPARHVDVGSRIDGFIAHLLVFMPVEVVDIRALESNVLGLSFVRADGATLESFADNAIESISSLHAVEHFGLGRYGDPVDPEACFLAMENMARILRPAGHLYFSVPIGRERVEFNAQRVFAPVTVLNAFSALRVVSFSAVDDDGSFRPDCSPAEFAHARLACGLFEFTK